MKLFFLPVLQLGNAFFLISLFWLNPVFGQLPGSDAPQPKNPREVIPGQYIVVFKNDRGGSARVQATMDTPLRRQRMQEEVSATLKENSISESKVLHVYETVLQGFSIAGLTDEEVGQLRSDARVDYIEPDVPVYASVPGEVHSIDVSEACVNPHVAFDGADNFNIGQADFGPRTNATGRLVLTDPANACGAAAPATFFPEGITGPKIALIDRGACDFSLKAYRAQLAGAVGVIIANDVAGAPPGLGIGQYADLVTIPVMSITQGDAVSLKAAVMEEAEVTAMINYGLPDNTYQCMPWGISRVGGGLPGNGKRAWIIDSGIDLDHPDLDVDITNSASFVAGSAGPNDENGHGTHVAGTVAALDNGQGVIGVAAGAKVVAVRVLNAAGSGTGAAIIAGLNYVAGSSSLNPADVVNISLGGAPSKAREDATEALAHQCKVVIAAGNDTRNVNFMGPARVIHPNVYTVSAMGTTDIFASFSNFGMAVRYCAPGVNILSCDKDGGYTYKNGTSMAAPHVAGLLLLGVDLCASKRVNGDKDGMPDPILTVATAADNTDGDGDGFTPCDGDQDDSDPNIYPRAEICDGIDNDNDGLVDEGDVCCPAGAATLYVNAIAGGANTGLSWSDAFTSLQSALALAAKCSAITQVWVAKGTYYPSADEFGNTNPSWNVRTKTFSLRNNLALYGGFAGNELPGFDLTQRNFIANRTVLDGDIQQNATSGDNVYNVIRNVPLYGQVMDETAVLDGFTISSGSANMITGDGYLIFPFSYGGGMFNYFAGPEVRNSVFEYNFAYEGGAMANILSDVSLKKSQVNRNSGYFGAGIVNEGSSPFISGSAFQLNASTYDGVSVSNYYASSPVIANSSFSGNWVANPGGGTIYNYDGSSPVITNSIIWGNSAGIFNEPASSGNAASSPQITYSIVQDLSPGGGNNLDADPLFVSQPVTGGSTLGDLRLQPCSPALNAGNPGTTTADAGTTDINGNARIYGTAIDIGSYELQRDPFAVSISADPGLSISSGSSVILTASGANSYTWSTSGTTASITVSPSETTAYTVTGEDGACLGTADAVVIVDGAPLPVSLVSFSAEVQPGGTVKLGWATTSEMNNAYYELEKSSDLKASDQFAKVEPLSTNEPVRKYSFTDEIPYKGRSYYRLSQVDLDGKRSTYRWVSVFIAGNYSIFPNPVTDDNFSLKLDEPDRAVLKFFTTDGKPVDFKATRRNDGTLNLEIPAQLQAGVYMLSVEEHGQTSFHRVIVNK